MLNSRYIFLLVGYMHMSSVLKTRPNRLLQLVQQEKSQADSAGSLFQPEKTENQFTCWFGFKNIAHVNNPYISCTKMLSPTISS